VNSGFCMNKAEALEKITEILQQLIEKQLATLIDISGAFTFTEITNVKSRLDEEINRLLALREEVGTLYLEEFEATGKAN
jgi:hypothetical protein